MEKKYLIVKLNGHELGAFENVTSFEQVTPEQIKFTSDEGTFVYNKIINEIGSGWVSDDCDIYFDDYQLAGRRTLNRHAPEGQRKRVSIGR